jgi:hypothetical protein
MLDMLKDKNANHLLDAEIKSVYGNQNAIRAEKRSRIDAILIALWPDLQKAVRDEIAVVTDHLVSAEWECGMATEDAKMATGIVFKATETLLASLDAVHVAEARIVDSQNAIIRAEANLKAARAEFAKLVERSRG